MPIFKRFQKDGRGLSFEGLALSVAVIAVVCVATADVLDYMGQHGELRNSALLRESRELIQAARQPTSPNDRLKGAEIDYTPVGAISGLRQRSVLDPCTMK